jgi:hypothetical protein
MAAAADTLRRWVNKTGVLPNNPLGLLSSYHEKDYNKTSERLYPDLKTIVTWMLFVLISQIMLEYVFCNPGVLSKPYRGRAFDNHL